MSFKARLSFKGFSYNTVLFTIFTVLFLSVFSSLGIAATLDLTSPTVTLKSPSTNGTVGFVGDTVTFSADAIDNVSVTRVEFYMDGSLIGTDNTAPYSFDWAATLGNHEVFVKGYDAAGNVGFVRLPFNIADQITIINPQDGTKIGGIPKISGKSKDQLYTVQLLIDGIGRQVLYNPDKNGYTFSYEWDTNQYNDGTSHVIEIRGRAADYTLVGTAKSTVIIDNSIDITAPAVSIVYPTMANATTPATVGPAGDIVTIKADATDKIGVTKVECYVNDILIGIDTEAPYNYDWTAIVGSNQTITVKAYDAAGNVGTTSSRVNVPAKVFITNPVDGSTIGGVQKISATINANVNSAALIIDGVQRKSLLGPDKNGFTFDYNWDTNQYADGTTHNVQVKVIMSDGYNTSYTANSTVTVDNSIDITAPAVNIVYPSMANATTPATVGPAGDIVTIKADATDKIGVTKVEFYVNDVLIGADTEAPYSYDWIAVVGSNQTITVKAYDAAGNVGTISSRVNVPAKVFITNPVDGSTIGGVQKISATMNANVNSAVLIIDGVQRKSIITPDKNGFTFDYNWDTNQCADGTTHNVQVKVIMSDGYNTSYTANSTVTVDNSIPIQ